MGLPLDIPNLLDMLRPPQVEGYQGRSPWLVSQRYPTALDRLFNPHHNAQSVGETGLSASSLSLIETFGEGRTAS
jgi:hypothetical protein